MRLDVLDADTLVRVGCVDAWVSLYWDEPYNTEGSFTLEVRPTAENLALLQEGCWVKRSDRQMPMRICHRTNANEDKNQAGQHRHRQSRKCRGRHAPPCGRDEAVAPAGAGRACGL